MISAVLRSALVKAMNPRLINVFNFQCFIDFTSGCFEVVEEKAKVTGKSVAWGLREKGNKPSTNPAGFGSSSVVYFTQFLEPYFLV